MTIIDGYTGGVQASEQLDSAIDAVVERALAKSELYKSVIGDQLLYVATSLMLERDQKTGDGQLEEWCKHEIELMERQLKEQLEFLQELLKDEPK